MSREFLFTSESVGEGHPDKICDQISDAILDAHLSKDPEAKVACECAVSNGLVILIGEVNSSASINVNKIVKNTIKKIGYDNSEFGFNYKAVSVHNCLIDQNTEIACAVHKNKLRSEVAAGDQGIMFGYATNETEEGMPLTLMLSHRLNQKFHSLRKSGILKWARPDSKAQVTLKYKIIDGAAIPLFAHTIVMSVQHSECVSNETIRTELMDKVIKSVIDPKYLRQDTVYHLQPSGRFVVGGPMSDAGLTGRKIIVDTYGGWGAHGGGAFSGKDYTKVDRSGAYAARWIAKSLLKANLCKRILVQISYSIGIVHPLAIFVDSYGTGSVPDNELVEIINKNFDLRPGMIAKELMLENPIYERTSVYGHFGRDEFTWEQPKKIVR